VRRVSSTPEAKRLAEEHLREVTAMPFSDLLDLIDRPVETEVTGLSGRAYKLRIESFWDMEPDDSELYTHVRVNGLGLRRYQRYLGVEVRDPGADAPPEPETLGVSSAWANTAGCLVLAVIALLLVAPWLVGVTYLISRAI
jgi:hypothetical protein